MPNCLRREVFWIPCRKIPATHPPYLVHFSPFQLSLVDMSVSVRAQTADLWGTKIVKMYSPDCAQMRSPAVKNPKFSGGRNPPDPPLGARAHGTSRRVPLRRTRSSAVSKNVYFSEQIFFKEPTHFSALERNPAYKYITMETAIL